MDSAPIFTASFATEAPCPGLLVSEFPRFTLILVFVPLFITVWIRHFVVLFAGIATFPSACRVSCIHLLFFCYWLKLLCNNSFSGSIHLCCVVNFLSPSHNNIFPQKGYLDGTFSTFAAQISSAYVDHLDLRRNKKTVRPHKERTAKYTHDTQI